MRLIVDDVRELGCEVVARTAKAGRMLLTCAGYKFDCICLGHDLGGPETGLDVLRYGIESNTLPPRVQLVTSNPVGREAVEKELRAAGYSSVDGVNWFKEAQK